MIEKAKSFLMQCSRVWQILRKPSMFEYKSIAKVSAIGILIIGFIGFAISVLLHLF